jgi:hypothetical protein
MELVNLVLLHHSGTIAGRATLQGATLILRQTAPNAGILSTLKGPSKAGILNDATVADLFCFFNLSNSWSGIANGEEKLGILVTAGRLMSPIHDGSLPS